MRREDLLAQLEAQIAALTAARRRWWQEHGLPPFDEDAGGAGVRVPADREDSPPRLDRVAAPLPMPRYHLDVIGTTGGKATTETKQ